MPRTTLVVLWALCVSLGASAQATGAVDHFLCYKTKPAKAPTGAPPFPKFAPTSVTLTDQTGGPFDFAVSKPIALCNPANKDDEDPGAPSRAGHEEVYQIKRAKSSPKFGRKGEIHEVKNQFHPDGLKVSLLGEASLFVPSSKVPGSGGNTQPPPADLDHFKCFKIKVAKAPSGSPPFPKFTPVLHQKIEDQFGTRFYDVRKPTRLCLPADKDGEDPTAPDHIQGLLCYQALASKIPPQPKFVPQVVSANNQFDAEVLTATKPAELCVPDNVHALSLIPATSLIGVGRTVGATVRLGQPAPAGGVTVTLGTSDAGVATIAPPSVTIAEGDLTALASITGVAAGSATLTADAATFDQAIANVSVTAKTITLYGSYPYYSDAVGKDLEVGMAGYLGAPAPAGNLQVTITSADPSRLRLSKTATGAGTANITVQVGAGSSNIPGFYVQALAATGTVDITATAPGYTSDTHTLTLQPSGFVLNSGDFSTTVFSPDTGLYVYPARLDPATMDVVQGQFLRGGLSASIPVTSGTPAVGTIVHSPAVLNGGDSSSTNAVAFHPVSAGTSTVSIAAPTGFSTPNSGQSVVATVGAPHIHFCTAYYYYCDSGSLAIGNDLQVPVDIWIDVAPPTLLTVAVTSAKGSVATITKDPALAGTASASFTNVSGTYVGRIYVQGRGVIQSTSLSAQAPNYTDGSIAVDVTPSGFVFGSGSFSTTAVSPDTQLTLYPVRLATGSLQVQEYQAVRGGLTVNVPVTSGFTDVGTIVGSPATFNGGDGSNSATAFHPAGITGTSNLTVQVPTGFSAPSTGRFITATVTAPHIYFCTAYYYYCDSSSVAVGNNLQVPVDVWLDAAPPNPITVTVTSADESIATVTTDPALEGTASVDFTNVTGTYVGRIYVQGRGGSSTSLSAQAPDYTNGSIAVDLSPSGFIFGSGDFSTTIYSPDTPLTLYPVRLETGTLQVRDYEAVRGGLTVDVTVTSAFTTIGAITGSPAMFNGGDGSNSSTAFHPVDFGMTTLTVVTPGGFSAPSTGRFISATVTAPHIFFCPYNYYYYCYSAGVSVGADLELPVDVYLDVAPPSPVTVTITSGDESIATLSTDAAVQGTASVSFNGVTGTFVGTIYVQGEAATNTTTLTAQATNYNNGSLSVEVDPSGWIFTTGDFTTSYYSADTSVVLYSARLDPTTLNVAEYQAVRGGASGEVTVQSSDEAVGTITGSPAPFMGGLGSIAVGFDPVGAGTTTITLTAPGFATPSNYQPITVTVGAPRAYFSSSTLTVGQDLQLPMNVYLDTVPPSPITVTITSSQGSIATVSADPTLAGAASVDFTGVTGTFVGTIYVQGASATNTTTLTAHANSYDDGSIAVDVHPSGFIIGGGDFSTSASSPDTALTLYSVRLDPTYLLFVESEPVRGGLTVDVTVSSSDAGVGTVIGSGTFNPNDSSSSTAMFHPVAGGTTTLTVEPPTGFSTPSNYQQVQATVTP